MEAFLSVPVLGAIVLCLLATYKFLIYPAYLSPLAKIPNPHFTCSILPIWIIWTRYQQRENKTVFAAHQKNGPVVRLGPNELSVCGVDGGIRSVYGSGFEKHGWYNVFANYGVSNMFSTEHSKPHAAIKKMVSNVYSKSYISSSPAVHSQTESILYDRLLPLLAAQVESKGPTEVVAVYYGTTMDFITAFLFGLRSSSKFLTDENATRRFVHNWETLKRSGFWAQELPLVTQIARYLGINLSGRECAEAAVEIEAWNLAMCNAASKILSAPRLPRDEPVVYGSLVTKGEKERLNVNSPLQTTFLANPRLGYASEVLDHLFAGFETSGITLTYLTHELSLNPDLQGKLRAELLTLNPPIVFPPPQKMVGGEAQLPEYKDIDALPILQAVLLETLRLHAAIPGIQPRVTPAVKGGTTLGTGEHVYSGIPGGVRIQASAYALHRNGVAFPEPGTFKYERWLVPASGSKNDAEVTKERAFWAFGSGGRMCVGSNFAMHELKMVVAAIYTNFTTTIVDDEGIEQLDGYSVGPKSGRLLVRFEKVVEN